MLLVIFAMKGVVIHQENVRSVIIARLGYSYQNGAKLVHMQRLLEKMQEETVTQHHRAIGRLLALHMM